MLRSDVSFVNYPAHGAAVIENSAVQSPGVFDGDP